MTKPFAPGLAPEDRLLFLCARVEPPSGELAVVAELTREALDWDYVRAASVRHGVAPLVSNALDRASEYGDLGVPHETRLELRRLRELSSRRNRRLYAVVREITDAFAAASIQILCLKDLGLAITAYPEPGLRPIGDLDLLIRRDDYDEAASCLHHLGFNPHDDDSTYVLKYGMGQHFERTDDRVWVDLQWNVAQREWDCFGEGTFTYDPEWLWKESRPLNVEGCELLVPTSEEMLFHLALHLEGHAYGELILVCDIAELLRAEGTRLDWNHVIKRAHGAASESSIYHALLLAELLLDAPVPPWVLSSLEPPCFRGTLLDPLFGNLAALHESLDDVRLAAEPPLALLERLQTLVRRQATQAMRAYRELDGFVSTLSPPSSRFVGFVGRRSERTLPTSALPPFEPLHMFVAGVDRAVVEQMVASQGYTNEEGGAVLRKRIPIRSQDPALQGEEISLTIEVDTGDDSSSCVQGPGRSSRRLAALRALRAQVIHPSPTRNDDTLRLTIHALPFEAVATVLARRLARCPQGRLFALVDLIRLLRIVSASDETRIVQLAQEADDDATLGALRAGASFAPAADMLLALSTVGPPPRLLERARVGATGVENREALRRAYLVVFAFLSSDWRLRRAVLRGALTRREARHPVLWPAVRELTAATRNRLRREFALERESFWAEP